MIKLILQEKRTTECFYKEEKIYTFPQALYKLPKCICTSKNPQQIIEYLIEEEKKRIKQFILKCLNKRIYFRQELQHKLIQVNFHKNLIEEVLSFFTQKDFLNETRDSRIFIHFYKSQRKSPRWIYQKLLHKQLSPNTITSFIEKFYTREEELENISYLYKKLEKRKYPQEKIIRSLLSKGFKWNCIQESTKK